MSNISTQLNIFKPLIISKIKEIKQCEDVEVEAIKTQNYISALLKSECGDMVLHLLVSTIFKKLRSIEDSKLESTIDTIIKFWNSLSSVTASSSFCNMQSSTSLVTTSSPSCDIQSSTSSCHEFGMLPITSVNKDDDLLCKLRRLNKEYKERIGIENPLNIEKTKELAINSILNNLEQVACRGENKYKLEQKDILNWGRMCEVKMHEHVFECIKARIIDYFSSMGLNIIPTCDEIQFFW
ncbi:Hypothetical protein ORPV_8 [Orpheovirus IHUMI-LCC2]|uniref:Uncharacterized protein n=1 Tax=Orpheovirus IHUMI-LCC2 TaxID=2023057 RepID=A0A2I2L303_9VIRU|nr:Hypothetical protein ORPV_8 [Orpheovirus IHUMI-LCC2]SNW61912.1 Hypothetical protein ORPV_8 [Orpheovirus IHUMI-LCC2]